MSNDQGSLEAFKVSINPNVYIIQVLAVFKCSVLVELWGWEADKMPEKITEKDLLWPMVSSHGLHSSQSTLVWFGSRRIVA